MMQKLVAGLNNEKKKCIMGLLHELKNLKSNIKNILNADHMMPNEFEEELLMYLRTGTKF